MSKYQAKMIETAASVSAFIESVPDKQKREDSYVIIEMMKKHSGFDPKMWGPSIVGFGKYHHKYESGHEYDSPLIAFSPRKSSMVLYIDNFEKKESMLAKLGKHSTSVACLYFKRLTDLDLKILDEMLALSLKATLSKHINAATTTHSSTC